MACWTRTSSSPRPGWAPVGIQPGAHDGASRHTKKWRDVATHLDDEDRWAAVVRRDRNADGRFYYSVRTTGVYCRPSCASRLARRENVRFHSTRVEAETAGFRPCKRCRPNAPALNDHRTASVERACRLIEAAEDVPQLGALAEAAGMSRFHFHRVFKTLTGVTPKAYAAAHRARRVRDELSWASTVTEAIYDAGFNSSSRFYALASEVLGMTPTDFRSGGDGTTIRFAVGKCSLGSILVAATDKGVCAILVPLKSHPPRLICILRTDRLFRRSWSDGSESSLGY